jgi:hypothetical protein
MVGRLVRKGCYVDDQVVDGTAAEDVTRDDDLPRRLEAFSDDSDEAPVTLPRRLGHDGLTYPIGFIQVTFNEKNGHAVGGMLIADNTGIPLEFIVTNAVRPTRAQHILYGKRLQSYVAVNLCGRELIGATKNKPKVIFVPDESMLALHAFTDIPVLVLRKGDELGSVAARPSVIPPPEKPHYEDVIDLTSRTCLTRSIALKNAVKCSLRRTKSTGFKGTNASLALESLCETCQGREGRP